MKTRNSNVIELYGQTVFIKQHGNANCSRSAECLTQSSEIVNFMDLQSWANKEASYLRTKYGILKSKDFFLYQKYQKDCRKNEFNIAVILSSDLIDKIYQRQIPSWMWRNSRVDTNFNLSGKIETAIIDNYMESLNYYFDHPTIFDNEMVEIKLREFIQILFSLGHIKAITKILKKNSNYKEISFRQVINSNLMNDISIQDLASLTNLSISSFKREFKNFFNETPHNYIQSKRLDIAKELLAISDKRVNEIAHDCLFKNPAHFARAFRKKYQKTPSEYRMSAKNKKASRIMTENHPLTS
ncbi:AraC family transcriptional regulator [Flagellimonas lutimaris]|uniref:AraC family transcriptional regulator n=1 Tax=Flagellimonas lutimaris TaxID=475082 RepID=A0A3A1NB61_9FLAO|nr:AraC family transcriptional regulator [Allomuricauda lutimaris]RIV37705.1 AraC family transcriptional regulator [Allomuricauda lutimaris]